MVHRIVDDVLDGLADGAQGLVSSIAGAVRGVGESVMGALDKPFSALLPGKEGPHRIIDRAADGIVSAGVNAVNQGLIGSARIAGEGIMKALDHPLEQIKGLELPKLFKR